MEIERIEKPTETLYRLTGRFDAHETARFKLVTEVISKDVCLDLYGVRFIDSAGLAAVIGLNRRCNEIGCELRIIEVQDPVRLIFEITQLINVLPIELPLRSA
jgi:anti-anti-sigma factor